MKRAIQKDRACSLEETLGLIRACSQPLEAERVPLANCLGRVLRQPVITDLDQPAFDRSAMDGYAVGSEDDSASFLVVDCIRAGEWKPRVLRRGEAVQIATGAALPGVGLQVVKKEEARREGERVIFSRRDRERYIRCRGEEAKAGQALAPPGLRLGPGALALLASVGCTDPQVTRMPRVLHLATGNEIVSCDQAPVAGQIRDSNSTLVRAFLGQWGIEPVQVRVPEDREAVIASIRSTQLPFEKVDLLLISGGASVGEHDYTAGWLESLGYRLHVRRTTTRPGKPLLFGSRGCALAFGLPGNPLAHFVCLNTYVRAALTRFAGASVDMTFGEGVLAHDCPVDPETHERLWPAHLDFAAGIASLTMLPWHSSGDLTALAKAGALARIPAGSGVLSRGTRVQFLSTSTGI